MILKEKKLDIKLSTEDEIVGLINRKNYKDFDDSKKNSNNDNSNSNKKDKSEIFHSDTEKFIITTIYANENFKVLNY